MAQATTPAREEQLLEFVSNGGVVLTAEPGVIKGVKVLGLKSANGRSYRPEAIRAAIPLYEGAKVNVNHPVAGQEGQPRRYQDRLGYLKGVRPGDDGLYADLHYNVEHPVAKQLAWDAANAPGNVGLSHNAVGKTRRENGQYTVEEIVSVKSVDLVAEPATTRGLFESLGHPHEDDMSVETATLEDLRAKNPSLLERIKADALAEARNSADAKARDEEHKKVLAELDGYKAKAALDAKRAKIDAKLTEAKLPTELVTDVFRGSLMEAKDDAAIAALIEDRAKLAVTVESRGSKPVSRSSHDAAGTGSTAAAPKDAEEFARRLRG